MSQLSRCSYAAPTPPIKSHTIHLNCVTPLCIYFNWVAARLQRSPRLPRPYSADTSGARCFLCLSFSPKSAAAASLQFFWPHHPLSSQDTGVLCGRSYQCFTLFLFEIFFSVLTMCLYNTRRRKVSLFTLSFDKSILHAALHRFISSLIFFEISGMHVCFSSSSPLDLSLRVTSVHLRGSNSLVETRWRDHVTLLGEALDSFRPSLFLRRLQIQT